MATASIDLTAASGWMLAACGVGLAPLASPILRRIDPPRSVFFARWGFSHLLLAAAVGLLVFVAGGWLAGDGAAGRLLRSDSYLFGAVVIALVAAQRTQPESWRALGLAHAHPVRAVGIGVVLWAFAGPMIWGCSAAWAELLTDLGVDDVRVGFGATYDELQGTSRIGLAVFLVAVAPLLREVLFRGFAQPLLVQNFSERGGVLLSALFFALLYPPGAFLPAFVLGVACALAYLRSGSLWAPLTVHALHQATAITLLGAGWADPERLPLF